MKTLALIAPLLLLGGCDLAIGPEWAQAHHGPTEGASPYASARKLNLRAFMQSLASGDAYEIRSGEMALTASANPDTKAFARRMIMDHNNTTKALHAIAARESTSIPPQMLPNHQSMIEALEAVSKDPAAFDRLYRTQQRHAHADTIALLRHGSERDDYPQSLRRHASKTLPGMEADLQYLKQHAGRRLGG